MPLVLVMGGRKFRLGRQRKNAGLKKRKETKKRRQEKERKPLEQNSLLVSLSLVYFFNCPVTSLEFLCSRLSHTVPPMWTIACTAPLVLCKLRVHPTPHTIISVSITINTDFKWTLSVYNQTLTASSCPLLVGLPLQLRSVNDVCHMITLVESGRLCVGNPGEKFAELWHYRSLTLHGSSGIHLCMLIHASHEYSYTCFAYYSNSTFNALMQDLRVDTLTLSQLLV